MKAIKFDKEKVTRCLESFYDQHGTYPYLICSAKTGDLIIESRTCTCMTGTITTESKLSIGNVDVTINKDKPKDYGEFGGAKILIDDALPFGEVLIVG